MTIPGELLKSTPRQVSLRAGGKAVMVFACFLILAGVTGGIWLYVSAENGAAHNYLRATESATTEGRVLTAARRQGKDSRWVMTYSFAVGGTVEQGTAVGRRKTDVGTSVAAHYMPNDPSDNWIDGYEPRALPIWVAPLFGVACLFAASLVAYSVRRQMNLLSYGRPTIAQVTKTRRRWHEDGGRRVQAQLEFRLRNGSRRQGWVETGNKTLSIGAEFVIVYDPDQPKRFARYPMPLIRI